MVHVLRGEVACVVLVQIPAVRAVGTLRAGVTLGALGTGVAFRALRTGVAFRALGTGVALRALRTGVAFRALGTGVALRALRTGSTRVSLRALSTHVALRPLRPRVTGVALRALDAGLTVAIQNVAGAVVIHVLGREVALIILVQVPAAHAVMTLRSLRPRVTIWPPGTGITLRA